MEIQKPKDLMGLFFKYRLNELPVTEKGAVVGRVIKSDLVRELRKVEDFNNEAAEVIDDIFQPADSGFLNKLKKQLREGEIQGIPLINREGKVERVLTPGILETEEKSEEYIDDNVRRSIYEKMISRLPFPVCLKKDKEMVFANDAYRATDTENWKELNFSEDRYHLTFFLPAAAWELFSCHKDLQEEKTVSFNKIMEGIEFGLLKGAKNSSDSISEAAQLVDLPEQIFNYRWEDAKNKNYDSSGDD